MVENSKLILLIDDNKDFLEIFGAKLASVGYRVVTAQGGEEGISEARKASPDLILLDLEMPGENGFEVLEKIRAEVGGGKFKVAFLTNYGEENEEHAAIDKKFAIEIGAVDHIRKSDDLNAIVGQVQDVMVSHS
jgi:CheY-like chemotaxis protein